GGAAGGTCGVGAERVRAWRGCSLRPVKQREDDKCHPPSLLPRLLALLDEALQLRGDTRQHALRRRAVQDLADPLVDVLRAFVVALPQVLRGTGHACDVRDRGREVWVGLDD